MPSRLIELARSPEGTIAIYAALAIAATVAAYFYLFPCALRDESAADGWLGNKTRPETPLVRYIFNDFDVVDTAGSFEFMLPKGGL
jgi:hypothetical protein